MKRKEYFPAYLSIKQIIKGLFFVGMVDHIRQKFGEERFLRDRRALPILLARESCYQYGINATSIYGTLLSSVIDDGFDFMKRTSATLSGDMDRLWSILNNDFSLPADGNDVCTASIRRVLVQTHGSGIELYSKLYEQALVNAGGRPNRPERTSSTESMSKEEFFGLTIQEQVETLDLVADDLTACDIDGRKYVALRTSLGLVYISTPGGQAGAIQPMVQVYGSDHLKEILAPITAPVTFHTVQFIANHLVGYVNAIEASMGISEIYSISN